MKKLMTSIIVKSSLLWIGYNLRFSLIITSYIK